MAITVKASLGTEKYYTEVVSGENKMITDEPIDKGGGNKGFNPYEILATSLASCTAATLRMYLDRKQWPTKKIHVEVELETYPQTMTAVFTRIISYEGASFDSEQFQRLSKIADACPVHKILHGNIDINTKQTENYDGN